MSEGPAPAAEPAEGNAHDWDHEAAWGDGGTYSYGYDADGNTWQDGDGVWEQQVATADFTPEEWQWVQDSGAEGYYFNSVTGEARWDDPAAFQEVNSHALVERGYEDAMAGQQIGTSNAPAGGASTDYYGEESNTFTVEDGTVWSYDETHGDYVQQFDTQPVDSSYDELFRLNPAAGSPWQRVESESGPYYYNPLTEESSWEPPPEWGAEYQLDEPNADGAGGLTVAGGGEDHDRGQSNYDVPQEGDYASSLSAANSTRVPYGPSGTGELEGGVYGAGISADAPEGAVDETATSGERSPPSTKSREQEVGFAGSGAHSVPSGGCSRGGESSGGGISLDRTSVDELSQWSLEKLREVSKTLPGKWLVSDFLVDRAVADYDMMLSMSESEIEDMMNKGTSRLIRSLVGPEPGEDDNEDDLSLPLDSEEEENEEDKVDGASRRSMASSDKRLAAPGSTAGSSSSVAGESGGASPSRQSDETKGRGLARTLVRRGSLLGLEQALSETDGYLGAWKPAIGADGSLFFVHQETGETRWSLPVRAWEVKTQQLALLTPRGPAEVGSGICRLRETDEMRKKRLAHRWKVEEMLAEEAARRRDNPTPSEAAEAALEAIVTAIERKEYRKNRWMEHNARALERSRWHPSAAGFLMKRLTVPPATPACASASAQEARETKMILTDTDFVDMKITQGGTAIPWGQEPSPAPIPATPEGGQPTSRRTGKRFAAALHSHLPARLLQLPRSWGALLLPSGMIGRTSLPSLRTLGSVRSMSDLKRELAAAATAKRPTTEERDETGTWKGAGTKGVTPKKAAAGKEKLAFGKAEQAEAVPAEAGDQVGAEMAAGAAPAEGKAPLAAEAPMCATDRGGLPQAERLADAATAAAADAPGDTGDGNLAAGQGLNAASLTSTASGRDQHARSSLSRKRRSSGNRAEEDWGVPPSGGRNGSSLSRSSAPKGKVSSTGRLEAKAGAWSTAETNDLQDSVGMVVSGEKRAHHPRGDSVSSTPLALPAVVSLDEQVRGLGAKLALKIEGGGLDPSRVGGAVAAMAKTTLVTAGRAVRLSNKPAVAAVQDKRARPLSPPPSPPDVSTVTIELACTPPPRNLLTTIRVKDPATGKTHAREELTSVLRDAWEGMIVRDIATAGGIDPRQVLIEEVRRRSSGSSTAGSSDTTPFRPKRYDESCRCWTRTRPTLTAPAVSTAPATPGSVIPPINAADSRFLPPPGAETAVDIRTMPLTAVQQQQQQQQQQSGYPLAAGGRWTGDGLEFEQPLALAGSLSLPPAGLRATLARRLATPVAKKRRLGDGSRGGSGGFAEDGGGACKEAGRGIKLFGKRGVDAGLASAVSDGDIYRKSSGELAGANIVSGRNKGEATAAALPPLGTTAPPSRSSRHHPDEVTKVSNAAPGGTGTRVSLAAKFSDREGTSLPHITGSGGVPTPGGDGGGRDGDAADEGAGGWKARRRGAVAPGAGPWVGMNFADRNDDDENAVGIGAGNRSDFGVLGRTEQRPGQNDRRRIRDEDRRAFDPADEGRVKDPKVQAAIDEATMRNPGLKSWQAKDGVMKAMNKSERIPTLHDLKLAGRVERARALFGPGGYLSVSESAGTVRKGRAASTAPPSKHAWQEGNGEDGGDEETHPGKNPSWTAVEGLPRDGAGGKVAVEEASPKEDIRERPPAPADRGRIPPKTTMTVQGPPGPMAVKETPLDVTGGDSSRPAGRSLARERGAVATTTVTLTIVGGRPNGRGFTKLEQSGKTPSETVASHVVLQAGVEGSDLLMGGLTHTAVRAHWCPDSRSRVMSTWEGYWCHSISPVFFGRSARARHVSKAEAARRRQREEASAAPAADDVDGPAGNAAAGPDADASSVAGSTTDDGLRATASATSSAINLKLLSLNQQLELAETRYQELLSEGLPDGVRMTHRQYKAMLVRDRTIKKLLLRRTIRAKRESGGLTRVRCPFRKITDEEARSWKKEIEDEERAHRAAKLVQDAQRREARINQLKAWLIRHLVASNDDDGDLMAKAIAAEDYDGCGERSGGYAGKGAPGRESSMSGRNSRPGGRFAYGQEASAEEIKKKDLVIKARRRFEQETEKLLRETFRGAARSLVHGRHRPTPLDSRGSTSDPVPNPPSSSPSSRDLAAASPSGLAKPPARGAELTRGTGGDGDGAGERDSAPRTPTLNGELMAPAVGSGFGRSSVADNLAAGGGDSSGNGSGQEGEPGREAGDGGGGEAVQQVEQVEQEGQNEGTRRVSSGRDFRAAQEEEEEEEEAVATSLPRSGLLRLLRKPGTLRRKVMASDAVRPILTDRDFTKAFLAHPTTASAGMVPVTDITEDGLVLFGSVVAEVDRWYKRVRATLDPVRANAESRVKAFEARKQRARDGKAARSRGNPDGLAPSEAWRRELKVERTTNRGDGREWSRFHHHVLIRTSDDLPLYCCLCRRRKWDEARLARLKDEHALRCSWDTDLSERQEILEPMVEAVIQGALVADRALSENDEGTWAALLCLESLVNTVPGRVESLEAAGNAVEDLLDDVMRESCSVEERTRKRRMAALAKLRALEAFNGEEPKGRRRSRRVSVGPAGFQPVVPPPAGGEARAPAAESMGKPPGEPETEKQASGDTSNESNLDSTPAPLPSRHWGIAAAVVATVAAGRIGAGVVPGRRRGFSEFSDQARAVAENYYRGPRERLAAAARAAPSWAVLRDSWFKTEESEGDGMDEEKALALQACAVEVLDGERQIWERQERERRGMFAQDESQRRDDETLRRAAEATPRETQEAGHRAFCALMDTMERRCQSLGRLRWELTTDVGDTQSITTWVRVKDAASGKRSVCRLLACRGAEDEEYLLKETYRIQEIRNPYLVKMHSAHPHRLATYDARGVQTTGGRVVLIQAEFCSGGTLEDHLKVRVDAASGRRAAIIISSSSSSSSDRRYDGCDREVIGPKSRKVYTPEQELMAKPEEEKRKRGRPKESSATAGGDGASAMIRKPGGEVSSTELRRAAAALPDEDLARRLEVWMRQVAHGLSALHAGGGLHRNINARSVYLDEKGRAKLGGYQFLKGVRDNSAGPQALDEGFGCAATAPPEFELHGETSAKGDVWCLGCAIYKWTTGKEFAYLAAGARLQDTLHLVPPSWGDKIKAAMSMCLQRDPGVRVSSLNLWKFMAASGDSSVAQ
eukprot:g18647.t1